ncbi:MAG TPA: MFS transporter [Polyangia bacterium]|nr:MFS transporter [Polyangia bacterium]
MTPAARDRRGAWVALALSYVGFVSLGLPDTVLGAAWPAIRADLGLPLQAAGSAALLTTAGVVLSSTASGWVRSRLGTPAVLVASTVLAAAALALSGAARVWSTFLAAAFVAGLGGGAIDAALNHLVARRHSARHMNWLHACWGVGASLTPLLVAWMLQRGQSWGVPTPSWRSSS